MRHALAIIENDVREKRFIFATAAVFAVIPFIALLIPGFRAQGHAAVATLANILAVNFVMAVALGLGVTMIGSDLSAGRLSFYFSKPITARELWYGKLVAALLTTYIALAIVAAPAALYAVNYHGGEWIERKVVLTALAVSVPALLLIAHVLSTFFRTRSAILVADAIALLIATGAIWLILRPLVDAIALQLLKVVAASIAGAIVAAIVLAGGWQLSRGRTDRRANHAALSAFLWSAMAVIVAVSGAYMAWVVRATPRELGETTTYRAPAGDWFLVRGRMPHRLDYTAAFLTNVATGESVRMPVRDANYFGFTFSRDGRTAAWTHDSAGTVREGEIWTQRLDPLGPIRKTGISVYGLVQLALSDDGSRIATVAQSVVNIADARTGRSIASARLPIAERPLNTWFFFVTPDLLRLYVRRAITPETDQDLVVWIFEFDARSRSLRQTGAFRGFGRWSAFAVLPDGQRAVVAMGPHECEADARTGACIASAGIAANASQLNALADGSIVHVVAKGNNSIVLYRAVAGQPLQQIPLQRGYWAYVAACSGMRVVVGTQETLSYDSSRTFIVNMASGQVEHVIPNIKPSSHRLAYEDDPRIIAAGGHVVPAVDAKGHVVRIDIDTGAVTPLPR